MKCSGVGVAQRCTNSFVYRKGLMEQLKTVGRRCPLIITGDTLAFSLRFWLILEAALKKGPSENLVGGREDRKSI